MKRCGILLVFIITRTLQPLEDFISWIRTRTLSVLSNVQSNSRRSHPLGQYLSLHAITFFVVVNLLLLLYFTLSNLNEFSRFIPFYSERP